MKSAFDENRDAIIVSMLAGVTTDTLGEYFGNRKIIRIMPNTPATVGFLIQDGKVNLDDKIVDFYDEAYVEGCGEMLKKQTIRDMLMMSTGHGDKGTIEYENAQGEKTFKFGFGKNVFGKFPQEGYSKEVGGQFEAGHYYNTAFSAVWLSNNILYINVQAIDDYFGRLHMYFQFMDENTISIAMKKTAEDFFNEYTGMATGYSL